MNRVRLILSEDWWAVVIGLALMVLVKIGLLGGLVATPWPLFP
jgi:hypothetical protein